MSQVNVDLVKRAVNAFNERDFDTLGAISHPKFEYHALADWPDQPRSSRGVEQFRQALARTDDELAELRGEPLELIDVGGAVVVVVEVSGIGKQSRAPVRFTEAFAFTISEGRIARIEVCGTREKALEVAGLGSSRTPQTPTAVVERLIEASNRANEEGAEVEDAVDRIVDLLDPEIEYVNPLEAIERGMRRGIDGMTEVVRSMRESLGPYRFEVERMVERGDAVAMLARLHAAGPGSGVRVAGPWFSQLITVRGDRIVRIEWFLDPERAFERLEIEAEG